MPPETVIVTPGQIRILPGEEVPFSAQVLDSGGQKVVVELVWSATGGAIDAQGIFQAGQEGGTFNVTASAGNVQGTATVDILKEQEPGSQPVRLEVYPQEVSLGQRRHQNVCRQGLRPAGTSGSTEQSCVGCGRRIYRRPRVLPGRSS